MYKLFTLCLILITVLFIGNVAAQSFSRTAEIDIPEVAANNGGIGDMVAGVDIDGDGNLEIYLVNDNWSDGPTEVIPRIYKLEQNGANWDSVWAAVAPVAVQNTWPQLVVGDLDGDGKEELIWAIINSTSMEANPYRLVVYEEAGDGSDVMGVATAATNINSGEPLLFAPNAMYTISEFDNENVRIMEMTLADPDGDGTTEICFADRKGNDNGYYFGVISVDDVPDNGDGSETWDLEVSGLDYGDLTAQPIENKWDVAVIGSNVYTFCEVEISKLSWDGGAWNYDILQPMAAGASVQSAQVVDLDGDQTEEIICATYDWGTDSLKAVMLLQEDGDSLAQTLLFNISSFWPGGSRGAWGGAVGDIDQDGYLDFVFGARAGDPDAPIFRYAYRGGDITDPASYEFSVIDSLFGSNGIWSVIDIVDIDGDPELEVLYTSSVGPVGGLFGATAPVIVLDFIPTSIGGHFEKYPLNYALSQNYPNPFNPSTQIWYTLHKGGDVNLVIYDLTGSKVKTLVSDNVAAGIHNVTWDGLNESGQQVASGTYIYQLTVNGLQFSKKMNLIR
jgi:flagellar hook capping protein FlgD/VCBS repeat protein